MLNYNEKMQRRLYWIVCCVMRFILIGWLFILSVAVIWVGVCSVVRRCEMYEVREQFLSYREHFESALNSESRRISLFNRAKQLTIPNEMSEIGIEEIYNFDDNTYFEFADRVLWMFPQGILHIELMEEVPDWYILDHIKDEWYYYRICS